MPALQKIECSVGPECLSPLMAACDGGSVVVDALCSAPVAYLLRRRSHLSRFCVRDHMAIRTQWMKVVLHVFTARIGI